MSQHSESALSLCLRYSKNSSILDAIHKKILPRSEVFERILVRILFKDYSGIEYLSCVSNILKKIPPPQDLPVACFVVTQHSETERFR